MWQHRHISITGRIAPALRWLLKTVAGVIVTTLVTAATLATLVYIGWKAAPPEVKHSIEVLVSVDAEGLTQAIKDLQEWAAIEVERARSN